MRKLWKLTVMFIAASVTGWLYEEILGLMLYGVFEDRGLLRLPLCPIYGVGALLIYSVCAKMKKPAAIFLAGALISTAAELGASYVTEWLLDVRLWDYSGWPLSLGWRISLVSSMIFGLLALYLMKIIIPVSQKLSEKLSAKSMTLLSALMIIPVFSDLIICLSEI